MRTLVKKRGGNKQKGRVVYRVIKTAEIGESDSLLVSKFGTLNSHWESKYSDCQLGTLNRALNIRKLEFSKILKPARPSSDMKHLNSSLIDENCFMISVKRLWNSYRVQQSSKKSWQWTIFEHHASGSRSIIATRITSESNTTGCIFDSNTSWKHQDPNRV